MLRRQGAENLRGRLQGGQRRMARRELCADAIAPCPHGPPEPHGATAWARRARFFAPSSTCQAPLPTLRFCRMRTQPFENPASVMRITDGACAGRYDPFAVNEWTTAMQTFLASAANLKPVRRAGPNARSSHDAVLLGRIACGDTAAMRLLFANQQVADAFLHLPGGFVGASRVDGGSRPTTGSRRGQMWQP